MRTCTAVLQHTGQVRPCLRITSRLHTPRLSGLHEAHCPTTACCVHCADIQSTQSLRCGLLPNIQCCFTSTETVRTIRDGEPRTSASTFTQLLSFGLLCASVLIYVCQRTSGPPAHSLSCGLLAKSIMLLYCFTSTVTVFRTIRDGEPRTATSTFIHAAPELCMAC